MHRLRAAIARAVVLCTFSACGNGTTGVVGDTATWTKHAGNPILTPGPAGSWDALSLATPAVFELEPERYMMWYTGAGASGRQIGVAYSTDGMSWTKHVDNPVLRPGVAGAWDGREVAHPSVRYDGTLFTMVYTGWDDTGSALGVATSLDGIEWTRSTANPVLTANPAPGSWDDGAVFTAAVVVESGAQEMWYAAAGDYPAAIGYATSSDGVDWSRLLSPVLHPQVLEALTFAPCVLKSGSNYRMWYGALHEDVGGTVQPGVIDYAQSRDGIEWTAHRTVLSPGPAGAWDADVVKSASVLDDGVRLRMWYEGASKPGGGGSPSSSIGLAIFKER